MDKTKFIFIKYFLDDMVTQSCFQKQETKGICWFPNRVFNAYKMIVL